LADALMAPRFGYVPYTSDLTNPGDRRRFPLWAEARGVDWEVHRPSGRYDVVVLAGTADLVRWRDRPAGGPRVVYELIDSYLELAEARLKSRLRGAAKFAARELSRPVMSYHRLIEDMCRAADAVVCSTPEQRARLLRLNPVVHDILDAHMDLVDRPKSEYHIGDVANLVWEGLPYTLDQFEVVAPALRRLGRRRPLALHLVTDLEFRRFARRFRRQRTADLARRIVPDVFLYEWNEQLLQPIVTSCDLAVIPLDLADPFARAKPENKLLLLWRLGMPTVVSATPAYLRTMAAAGIEGMACQDANDWEAVLERMLGDEGTRRDVATVGRRYVEANYSRDTVLSRWDQLFAELLT
jgi:glycosyltransferase involved in cell wall biosynthesis